MFVLGLMGSPRKRGNSNDLMSFFMTAAEKYGAETEVLLPHKLDIKPCRELTVCERKGYCPISDDMDRLVYPLIKKADVIVVTSPVFFYGMPAQIKALIDRCQLFWGRKYKLGLKEPKAESRTGVLLACGASGGKRLFEGLELTARIFFDALSVSWGGSLVYRHIEKPGEIKVHPDAGADVEKMVKEILAPFSDRKTILFVSERDACRSQMAAAFFSLQGKCGFNVLSAGVDPASDIYPETVAVMAEKQIDLKYCTPLSLAAVKERHFDVVVCLGEKASAAAAEIACREIISLKTEVPEEHTEEKFREIRDEIASKVAALASLHEA